MNTMKTLLAGTVLLTGALCSSVEAAPTWTLTAEGTITFGVDFAGVFGPAEDGLVGMHYIQTITASTDPGQWANAYDTFYNISTSRYGAGPGFTQTFTLNGTTVSHQVLQTINGEQTLSMDAAAQWLTGMDMIRSFQYGNDTNGYEVTAQIDATTFDPAYAFVPSLDFAQHLAVDVTKANTADWFSVGKDGWFDVFLGGSIDTLRINESDVPEPATLALVSLGLAGLGLARRRKRTG